MNKPLLIFFAPLAYLCACLLISALLAYPLHFFLPTALGFHTLVGRGAEVVLVLGLAPLGRYLGVHKETLGVTSRATFARGLIRGLGYGVLMLAVHVLILLVADIREINHAKLEFVRFLRLGGKALLIGLAVASIEEPVFRGFLFGALRQRTTAASSVFVSAAYFAALHFLDTDLKPTSSEIHWNTGLVLVADAFAHLASMQADSFLALFAAGVFLGCLRVRYPDNGLGLCMGVHAGWVFVIKLAKPFTRRVHDSAFPGWISNFDGVIGYFSAAWTLSITLLLVLIIWRKRAGD